MQEKKVSFYSEGMKLAGLLRLPDRFEGKLPVIVQGTGFISIKELKTYVPYHERFTDAGYAVFIFDYRGFGESEGERGLLIPLNQVQDIRNAITYTQTRDDIDHKRIGLLGSGGTGGSNAVYVAAVDPRVLCTVCNVGVGDGAEWVAGMRRRYEWIDLLGRIDEVRKKRVLTGEDEMVDPINEVMIQPPHRIKASSKKTLGDKLPSKIPFRCIEALIEFKPEELVDRIAPRAIMWIGVEQDVVTPEDSIIRMYEKAKKPKRLVMQKDVEHYYAYSTYFEQVVSEMLDWYNRHLVYSPFVVASEE